MKQKTHEKTTISVLWKDYDNYKIIQDKDVPKNAETHLEEYKNYYIIFYEKMENKEQWC